MALTYHQGQIDAQDEANTRPVAERLTRWVGPVGEFAAVADLLVLAAGDAAGVLRFAALSGAAPLVSVHDGGRLRLDAAPPGWQPPGIAGGGSCGAIAISLGQRRRARFNGAICQSPDGWELTASESFINCRKYLAPSAPVDSTLHAGPLRRTPLAPDDPWLRAVLAEAETAFLGSVSPAGLPDVSHRGGPRGFLTLDAGVLAWPEYVGDGMFKSAGNVRATGVATLLALDLATGDAAELWGSTVFSVVRREAAPRAAGLLQDRDPFPVQGAMQLRLAGAARLHGMLIPRRRVAAVERITSCSPIAEQAPA